MEQYQESFESIKPITPPPYLFHRIFERINREKELGVAKRKAAYFSIALTGSVALFSAAIFSLWGSLIESEILKLVSVFVSDPGSSFMSWQESTLFLLESLPVVHLIVFLVTFLAALQSLKYVVKYTNNIFLLSKPLRAIR